MPAAFTITDAGTRVVATAIHAGHDLRPSLSELVALDDATRLREEDPYTDLFAPPGVTTCVVHRSRFEVDLNRPRGEAVYRRPEDAWGLQIWKRPLPEQEMERSLALYDEFYGTLAEHFDRLAETGPFLVLDLHSYNHLRDGPLEPPAPLKDNPEVNLGTGSLDRERWGGLAEAFVEQLARQQVRGRPLDVRENVRFRGGELSKWVHRRYGGVGAALAIEFKKVFMDEWSGELDRGRAGELRTALNGVLPTLVEELRWPARR